jgi:hypothetical protein
MITGGSDRPGRNFAPMTPKMAGLSYPLASILSVPENRIWVEAWSPEYGTSWEVSNGLAPTEEEVAPFVETEDWRPLAPPDVPWPGAAFLDGVSRIDARAFLDAGRETVTGLCGSVGVGSVTVNGSASFGPSKISRTVVFGGGHTGSFPPVAELSYTSKMVPGKRGEDVYLGLQSVREELEFELAAELAHAGWVVIADGAVGVREPLPVVGFIKSHHKAYLGPELEPVVRGLGAGERTPIFMFGIIRPRYSWYLRLAGGEGHPWAAVVRCEVSATLAIEYAIELADLTARHLPRFSSKAFWDGRAPQNLVPIATLERRLWHLLGDRHLVYRRLRSALYKEGGSA